MGQVPPAARLLAFVVAMFLLAACARPEPEQALRQAVASLQQAIEQRDAAAMHAVLADDFIGPEGLDRDGVRRTAVVMFRRYRDVGVTVGPLEVTRKDQHATVRFTAALTGGAQGLPETGQLYDVETGWRQVGDEWRLVRAEWTARF